MFLKNLTISNGEEVIRSIDFHKGINLIIDETRSEDKKQSGNNVGKTTIIRLIDYCFGGDGKNIYKDTEFKLKTNTEIEAFLKKNNIIVSLTLQEDLENEESEKVIIKRNFLQRPKKIQEINGVSYTNDAFQPKLKELIFKSSKEKPTFRQIIAKNIRDEKNRLTNTLKVLDQYSTQEEYEALYLFWLGVEPDDNTRKQQLMREKSIEENLQRRLKKEYTLSQIQQSLIVINRTIGELEIKKRNLNINDQFSKEIKQLNALKYEINRSTTELRRLEFRKSLILESKTDLEKEHSNIDPAQVKRLYEEAKAYIPNIQKTFEETLSFHNQMVKEKIRYITLELPTLEEMIQSSRRNIDALVAEESQLSKELIKTGVIEGLESIIADLNKEYEKKGNFEELNSMWEASMSKLDSIAKELKEINDGIRSKDHDIQNRIGEFNKFFSDLSFQLYGERFILSSDPSENGYELNISSISGNLGTGKKKGQIAAFDLAYIKFADSLGIECLHFILHDQIENVHGNQIQVLMDIVNNMNCQLVIPILRDKLPPEINAEEYKVISLSQSNKLFKVN